MSLAESILKKINKKFEPHTTVSLRVGSQDIALQTDEEGNAIRMFIGKLRENGLIKGDRYARNLVRDREGKVIKDFWDRKGKAS